MGCQIQGHQQLEDHRPLGVSYAQETDQGRCGTSICNHIQDRAKLGGLAVPAGCHTIQSVKDTGQAVKHSAVFRVPLHVKQ